MNNLYFSHTVENIDFDKKSRLFLVQTSRGEYFARNICLGTGKQPYLHTLCEACDTILFPCQ